MNGVEHKGKRRREQHGEGGKVKGRVQKKKKSRVEIQSPLVHGVPQKRGLKLISASAYGKCRNKREKKKEEKEKKKILYECASLCAHISGRNVGRCIGKIISMGDGRHGVVGGGSGADRTPPITKWKVFRGAIYLHV